MGGLGARLGSGSQETSNVKSSKEGRWGRISHVDKVDKGNQRVRARLPSHRDHSPGSGPCTSCSSLGPRTPAAPPLPAERETSVREPTQGLPVSTQGYAQSPGPSPSSIQTVPYLFKKHSWWASTGSGTVLDSRDIRMPRKGTSDLFGV